MTSCSTRIHREINPSTPHAHLASPLCKGSALLPERSMQDVVIYVHITEPHTTASASYTKPEMVQGDTRRARHRPAAATPSQALGQSDRRWKVDLGVGSARLACPIMTPRSAQHPDPTGSKSNPCAPSFLKLPSRPPIGTQAIRPTTHPRKKKERKERKMPP